MEQATLENLFEDGLWERKWYNISFATKIDQFSVGANVRHMTEELLQFSESALALDLSAMFWVNNELKLGVLIQNLNEPDLLGEEPMVRNVRPGISYKLNDTFTIAADIYAINEEDFRDFSLWM